MRSPLDMEQAAIAAGADACHSSCACHGGIVCQRAAHDHDADQVVPHLGYDADGQLVQWVHTDEHGPMLTDDQVAEQAADVRAVATRALLDQVDPALLVQMLKNGGHL